MHPTGTIHLNAGSIWWVDGQGEQPGLPDRLPALSVGGSLYRVMAGRHVDHYCMCNEINKLDISVETTRR